MAATRAFSYRAYSRDGRRTVRTIKAATIDEAKRRLWNDGFRIVTIQPRKLHLPGLHELFPTFFKVRKTQIILFTRQLATFVKVGVPLLEALAVLHGCSLL